MISIGFAGKNAIKEIHKARHDSDDRLRKYALLGEDGLFSALSSSSFGLTQEQAQLRLEEFGENVITFGHKNTVFFRLKEAIINPFNVILLVVALITYFTDVVLAPTPDYLTVLIVLALVFLSGAVAFIHGERSNAAAERLSRMISNQTDILRDGEFSEIAMDQVVAGDIVRLSAGDMLPADLRFLSTKDMFIAQSALTGESMPVEKTHNVPNTTDVALTDLENIGFMGSNVVSGSARAVILATGNDTYFGSMAQSLTGKRARNSFERGVDAVSGLLIRMMLVMVPVVFLINGLAKKDWLSALLFSVSVAVGLTPEMLPVIMTSTLAAGAVSMSKHKVIMRTLGAIQTFGEMDILCTDKTGTLTEDEIILEKYMDVHGNDDKRILRHAFLNSHFQSGLKNLIDIAIIRRAEKEGLASIRELYTKIDEIPFDFARRRMSVVLKDRTGKRQLITKGAVEEMMEISSFVELDGKVVPMTEETRKAALRTYEGYNRDGLRMLGVAQKNEVPDIDIFSVKDEKDMVLIGFVGFLDPPKESAKAAVTALKDHGVRTIVLTGDSEGVAVKVCSKVGVKTEGFLTGLDVDRMDDDELLATVPNCDLYAKLSPNQKERIVKTLQKTGHTVGYLGDGINDAPALRQADVGISVDNAVDIAKETADVILLEKDLMVLEEGVIRGRRTFGNVIKYIKMAASGNFGNVISVIIASIVLPFLPMLPVQILAQNLLTDFSQLGMPFDRVDDEYTKKPRRWDTASIKTFMAILGPLSSVFDVLCFAVLWWVLGATTKSVSPLFHAGWFSFGIISQVLVIHMIRTARIPFLQSNPTSPLLLSTLLVTIATIILGFTHLAGLLDMMTLPLLYIPWLIALLAGYLVSTQLIKAAYIRRYGDWM